MADSAGMRVGIGGLGFTGGGLVTILLERTFGVVEVAMAPEVKSACQQALETMSGQLSECMKLVGGG